METKQNEPTHNRPKGDRTLDAPCVEIELVKFVRQIKQEDAWYKNDRNAITVFKSDNLTIVVNALRAGAKMAKENAADVMSVQVLNGDLEININSNHKELAGGQMVVIHKGYTYEIVAKNDAVFILWVYHVSGTDTIQ